MNFCPVCGDKTEKTFCEKHEKNSFEHKDIVLRVCECKKYFYRNRWNKFNNLKLVAKKISKECIEEGLKTKLLIDEKIEKKNFEVEVIKNGEKFLLPAKLQVEKCPVCSKNDGTYFVSTIQIRPKNKEVLEFVKKQVEKDEQTFISKINLLKEGYDILLSSNKVALKIGRKLTKSFKGELKTSRHLFGRDKQRSRDLYRVTVCFRME
ncbi:hypothetical protein CMO90_00405 [Candidatus Woesearchaeota archaeon]|jgi:nonsense-mediated mRNA decay protein 3|nr:hypothetical protein [Candidatus Woesearchaeota archaeon]|tara:strand:+ start:879 stop:1499 length:621 start_codon:yes stop_codon:yes gene_type:complete